MGPGSAAVDFPSEKIAAAPSASLSSLREEPCPLGLRRPLPGPTRRPVVIDPLSDPFFVFLVPAIAVCDSAGPRRGEVLVGDSGMVDVAEGKHKRAKPY